MLVVQESYLEQQGTFGSGSPSVVPGPAASAPPGTLLEMQILKLHRTPTLT